MNRILGLPIFLNLQLFAAYETPDSMTTTSTPAMSPTMKTFYDKSLLENAREALVFDQFAEHKPMSHGNTAEFRRLNKFEKALTPLTEGVAPSGSSFGMTNITVQTTQHGDYVPITDRLEYEAYDDIIYGCTVEMGAAAGATSDTLTRNIISAGNSVAYAPTSGGTAITSRKDLDSTCLLTPGLINKARTFLVKNNAPKIKDYYVAIINPSVAEDLRNSNEWKEYHKYNDTAPIFKGETGELHGVRFIESNEAKIHAPGVIATTAAGPINRITCKTAVSSSTTTIAVNELDGVTASNLNIPVYINGVANTITAIGSGNITIGTAISTLAKGAMICGQGAGKDGSCTYDTLIFGMSAYGRVEPSKQSMQMIIKDKKEIGGPLEQYSTVGYKFGHGALILYQERIIRLETGSSYSFEDVEN